MKKTFISLLVAVLFILIFTVACQNKTAETTATSTQSVETSLPKPTISTTTATTTTPTIETTQTPITANSVKLLTFNLRYDTTSHPCMTLGVRGPHLMEIVKKYDPDSIGFCEATDDWMNYLRKEMSKLGYSCVGVGRQSGNTGGSGSGSGNEHSPVFYKAEKYDLLETKTFWISETPEVAGSTSWDTSTQRICTYAVLKSKDSDLTYAHFNTHLDHVGPESRTKAVLVIEGYIQNVLNTYGNIGITLSGDLNDTMSSDMYRAFLSFMDDSRNIAKETLVIGATANGYDPKSWEKNYAGDKKPTIDPSSPIDYIFLGKNTASVSVYTVVDDLFTFTLAGKTWTDHPFSDHYGVYCEASFVSPTNSLKYDENKLVSYRADFFPAQTLPDAYQSQTLINDRFSITSTHSQTNSIENLLKNDSSVASILVNDSNHNIWEITLSAETAINLTGISFTTGTSTQTLPKNLRVYLSNDGQLWNRLGSVYTEELVPSTTYYLSKPSSKVRAKYVKLVFSNCPSHSELSRLNIYGN